jgi:Cu2+-exporting ATPase
MILTIIAMVVNYKLFIGGFRDLFRGKPGRDTTIAIGTAASFIYSVFSMINGKSDLLFIPTAIALLVIYAGRFAEKKICSKNADSIKSLLKHLPEKAVIVDKYDREKEIPADQIKQGDIFVIRPGDIIPADGVVIEGNSSVNEIFVTGEKTSTNKVVGDTVFAATSNKSGFIKCRATGVGDETTLSKMIRIVEKSSGTQSPVGEKADRLSVFCTIGVLGISVLTFILWMIFEADPGLALLRAVTVLVVSCPGVFALSVPIAIMTGNAVGARSGILFRNATALQTAGMTQIAAFNKTGTITKGDPVVTDVFTVDSVTRSGYSLINNSENELLKIAGLLEKKSDHPLARAVVSYVGDIRSYLDDIDEDEEDEVRDFEVLPGHGLKGKYKDTVVYGASFKYISDIVRVQPEVKDKASGLSAQGKTPLCFAKDNKLLGIIAVADQVRDDCSRAIGELGKMGIRTVMITGDNERTALAVGKEAGVDDILPEILPDGKESVVIKLRETGSVAMVGDSISCASSLKSADLGIAIGAGADISAAPADIVLMKESLLDVSAAIRLSREVNRNINQNCLLAALYNCIAILIAAGGFIIPLGFVTGPVLGALCGTIFSLVIPVRALGLDLLDISINGGDRPARNSIKDKEVSITM